MCRFNVLVLETALSGERETRGTNLVFLVLWAVTQLEGPCAASCLRPQHCAHMEQPPLEVDDAEAMLAELLAPVPQLMPQASASAALQHSISAGVPGVSGGGVRKAARTSCRACRISKVRLGCALRCSRLLLPRLAFARISKALARCFNIACATPSAHLPYFARNHAIQVRCDLEACAVGTACTRCARLGTQCIPNGPSMRGKVSAARLGPKVRSLLADAQVSAPAELSCRRSSYDSALEGSGHSEEPQPGVLSQALAHRAGEQPIRLELCASLGAPSETRRGV